MPLYDLPLEELREHVTQAGAPDDLAAFWAQTLADADRVALDARFEPAPTPYTVVETFDVTYAGYGGDPIRAWFHVPEGTTAPLPCVVEYVGYGGGRGLSHQHTFWASAGFAQLVMDVRGRGARWSVGHTADPNAGYAAYPGVLTRGALDPADYYYRRVYVDAVRAVDVARGHPSTDAKRIAVAGASQGGALSIAVAALRGDVRACLPEVPFLADIRRATEIADTEPYREIAMYLKAHRDRVEQVFHTMSFFDVALLGPRAKAPALFAVGLMDDICPPSTVYAAYNAHGGRKQIIEYAYNEHDGGGEFHQVAKVDWLRSELDG